jgi:membrane-associated phospholipid phosphatase
MGMRGSALLVVLCAWWPSGVAHAAEPDPLRFDTTEALVIDTTLGLGFIATHFLTNPPDTCSVCSAAAFEVSAARTFGSESNAYLHHVWSTWLLGGMLVAAGGFTYGAGAHEGGALNGVEDLVAVAEAVVAADILTRAVKIVVQRKRPGALLDVASARIGHGDANYAFFSGHASVSAAATMAVATVAQLRGYPWKFAVGAIGATLSLTIGLARLASYRHWLSDVLVGWIVGAAAGVLMPFLLHGGQRDRGATPATTVTTVPILIGTLP